MQTKSKKSVSKTQIISSVHPQEERFSSEAIKITSGIDEKLYYSGFLNAPCFDIFSQHDNIIADKRESIKTGDYVAIGFTDPELKGKFQPAQFIKKELGVYHYYKWVDGKKKACSLDFYHVDFIYKITQVVKCLDMNSPEMDLITKWNAGKIEL